MDEIFTSFKKSLERMEEILRAEKSIANRDSAIKRFELTVELAWKSIQRFLKDQKIVCRSPKECLREAFTFGIIVNEDIWLKMMDDRNESVHTYNESFAEDLYIRLPQYTKPLKELIKKLRV